MGMERQIKVERQNPSQFRAQAGTGAFALKVWVPACAGPIERQPVIAPPPAGPTSTPNGRDRANRSAASRA
jgi:hypothetical protein